MLLNYEVFSSRGPPKCVAVGFKVVGLNLSKSYRGVLEESASKGVISRFLLVVCVWI